jgi:hypothetical protein
LPIGPSFHFTLNSKIYFDNRIPPRGFTNDAFTAIQSPPIGYQYEDGQYWDQTTYTIPPETDSIAVLLYYQTLSKEYVTFLRDANTTNNSGQILFDLWETNGKSAPVAMVSTTQLIEPSIPTDLRKIPKQAELSVYPNPTKNNPSIHITLYKTSQTTLEIMNAEGSLINTLIDQTLPPGTHHFIWKSSSAAKGIYFCRLTADDKNITKRILLIP